MMLLVLLITLPIIFTLFIHYKTKKALKSTILPPGPPPLPVIGNLHQLGTATNLHLYLHQLSKKYGPIIHMKLGSVPLLVISSPKLAKEVLKNQDSSFCSRPRSLGQQRLSYNNSDIAFSPYNDYFKEIKRIISVHLLSLKKIKSFRPVLEDEISRMITNISSSSSSSFSSCSVVNFGKITNALGSRLISRVAFGKEYDEHGVEMRRFHQLLQEAEEVVVAFYVSDYFPAFGWVDKLTGLIRKVDTTFEKLDSFYQELIDDHLDRNRDRELSEEEDGDFLDVLIRLKLQNKLSSIDLGWDHVKALLTDIFIGATDTSSSIIAWTMTALMKYPTVMEKLQDEIRSLIGERGKVDEDDLVKLPYLKAVVKESMRLYPPGPLLIPRETLTTCSLEGYQIQPKTMVFVNAWAVARDPDYWINPNEFEPERFFNGSYCVEDENVKGFGFIPFGSGRRMCPGMALGHLIVELTVANLVNSFDWELPNGMHPDDVDTDPTPGLVVQKKNALLLVPKNQEIKCAV